MDFYAAGYKFEDDVFYDFGKQEDTNGIEPTCLLPTKEIVAHLIDTELGDAYFVVPVELNSLDERTGNFTTTIDYSKTEEFWEI